MTLAAFAGTGTYLYFAADSIMQEVRDSRPQVTIKVRAKRLVRRKRKPPAETPAETAPEGTGETKPEQTAATKPEEPGERPTEGAAPSAAPAGKSAALQFGLSELKPSLQVPRRLPEEQKKSAVPEGTAKVRHLTNKEEGVIRNGLPRRSRRIFELAPQGRRSLLPTRCSDLPCANCPW